MINVLFFFSFCNKQKLQCKCDGFQRRSVKCYDELTKTESNRCPEPKPGQKRKCLPAADCRPRYSRTVSHTCHDVQRTRRTRLDGEYTLTVKGTPVSIYCHNMSSNAPTEYLTLKSGELNIFGAQVANFLVNVGPGKKSSFC